MEKRCPTDRFGFSLGSTWKTLEKTSFPSNLFDALDLPFEAIIGRERHCDTSLQKMHHNKPCSICEWGVLSYSLLRMKVLIWKTKTKMEGTRAMSIGGSRRCGCSLSKMSLRRSLTERARIEKVTAGYQWRSGRSVMKAFTKTFIFPASSTIVSGEY